MKSKILTLFISLNLLLVSCNDFLDRAPQDFLSPENFYTTEASLEQSLVGVYDVLGNVNLYGGRLLYYYGFDADDGHYARNSPSTGPMVYNFSSSDINVFSVWETLYKGVSRANILLANVDKNPALDESFRNQIRGEALFLRAYYYFMLVQLYGDVPLITKPVDNPKETQAPRTSSALVYAQILDDLRAAEMLVKDITELGFGGRASKSAVRGIAARVCLHMAGYPLLDESKYEEAREWAKKVMDDPIAKHELNPIYSKIFINYAQDIYDIKESILEVEFFGNDNSSYKETGWNGYINGPSSNNTDIIGKTMGLVYATGYLWDKFPVNHQDDTRKFWTIANYSYNLDGTKKMSVSTAYPSLFYRFCGKYRREYESVTPKTVGTPQNYPLLRFSDVLLMFAEAENAINGPTQEAIDAVNKVRRRAWSSGVKKFTITNAGTGYTTPPTITFTGGGGYNLAASSRISGGKVTSIQFNIDPLTGLSNGLGYISVPEIIISGGGGTGATATCELYDPAEADVPVEFTASKEKFLEFIQNERSRELSFESLRRSDLIRWGIFFKNMDDVYNIVVQYASNYYYINTFRNVKDEKHLLWPIPSQEIALNPALTQNKHW